MSHLKICLTIDNRLFSLRWRNRILPTLLSPLMLLVVFQPCMADSENIIVLTSGTSPVYQQVFKILQSQIDTECSQDSLKCGQRRVYLLSNIPAVPNHLIPPNTKLIITLGVQAGNLIRNMHTAIPVIHALIPRAAYEAMGDAKGETAVYLDQPISRQLQLTKIVRPNPRLGLLFGPSTKSTQDEWLAESMAQDIPISYKNVATEDEVGPLIKELLEKNNILLALPDPAIFNQRTIFNILLSSYHNKVPVIGFSSAYVKAGALIAVYSTPNDIARHLAEITESFLHAGNGVLPIPTYPKYFSIAINNRVAQSLGISLPDEADIIHQMTQRGKQ